MKLKILFAAAAFTIPALGIAGPAQRADIPANPAWVLHFDVDAVRPSAIGQALEEQLQRPEIENKLGAFRAMFNFDPRTGLHGISLYSTSQRPEDGVLVVYADFDAARLETLAKGAKQYEGAAHRTRTIHSWIDDRRKKIDGQDHRVYAAIAGQRVLFGQQQASVAAALDVLDGLSPNLASSQNFSQLGTPAQGRFLQMFGRDLRAPGSNPNAALLKLSDQVRLEIGETQGQVNGTLTLQARDSEVATHLTSVAQGVLALMKLQTEQPARVRFAEALQLTQQGNEVIGNISLPANEVVGALKKAIAKKTGAQ